MSQTTAVWSTDRSSTAAAHMCDDAPNPWVNNTAGPVPVASWKIKAPLTVQIQGRVIIPAAAVWWVVSSMRTKLPVVRLRR